MDRLVQQFEEEEETRHESAPACEPRPNNLEDKLDKDVAKGQSEEMDDIAAGLEEELGEREQMEMEDEEDDIQFFHHKLLLQQHLGHSEFEIGSAVNSYGSQNGHVNNNAAYHVEECDDDGMGNRFSSENPFVFPDNVIMEYGEQAQFFPGNCVGYLETILEETDEEFEEEEGCSGRHWWTNDSDTDTDSVIRVDGQQNRHSQLCNNTNNPSSLHSGGTNLKSINNVEDLSAQSSFRTSASSRPFELEDLHLLDQLDLAFEETLMEPRRRSGFAAFGNQLHFLDQPLEKRSKVDDERRLPLFLREGAKLQRSASHDGEIHSTVDSFTVPQIPENDMGSTTVKKTDENKVVSENGNKNGESLGNAESKETFGSSLSPSTSSSDSEPHEVAEEDFFYSSPGSDESEEGHSSSDDSEKAGSGRVLAEFSLSLDQAGNTGFNEGNNSFGMFGSGRNRRSLDSPGTSNRLKSFRSFDSLNSLSGTELLFSKADTFPSFHHINEDVEPADSSGSGSPTTTSPRCNLNLTSCSTNDVPGAREKETVKSEGESQSLPSHNSSSVAGFPPSSFTAMNKKTASSSSSTASSTSSNNSGMIIMSSENLSEDSGIGGEGTSHPNLLREKKRSNESLGEGENETHQQQEAGESANNASYISKPEFALNPLVFSSISSYGSSNSPSINSVPSLNNNESSSSPSAEFSSSDSEFKENHASVAEEFEKWDGESRAQSAISNNSLSNFHQEEKGVDEGETTTTTVRIESSPQSLSNGETTPSTIPFQHKLPIYVGGQSDSGDQNENDHHHCSPLTSEESAATSSHVIIGLHPCSHNTDLQISSIPPSTKAECTIADKADTAERISDSIPDNPISHFSTERLNPGFPLQKEQSLVPSSENSNPDLVSLSSLSSQSTHLSNQTERAENSSIQGDELLTLSKDVLSSTSVYNNNETTRLPNLGAASPEDHENSKSAGVGVDKKGVRQHFVSDEHQHQTKLVKDNVSFCLTSSDHLSKQMANRHANDSRASSTSTSREKHHYSHPHSHSSANSNKEEKNSGGESDEFRVVPDETLGLDSIALAWTIVHGGNGNGNSSSNTSVSSTTKTNNKTSSHSNPSVKPGLNDKVNSENRTVMKMSTLTHQQRNGMQQKVDVGEFATTSPSLCSPPSHHPPHLHTDCVTGQSGYYHNKHNESSYNDPIVPTYTWPARGGDGEEEHKKNNAKINSLPHRKPLVLVEQNEEDRHLLYNAVVAVDQISSPVVASLLPQNDADAALGQEEYQQHHNGIKHSNMRSVNSGISSGTDEEKLKSECNSSKRRVDKDKHNHNKIGHLEEYNHHNNLVIATPVDPIHIGVASVKKFGSFDTSVSRKGIKPLHHQPKEENEVGRVGIGISSDRGFVGEEAILGQSNFGYFGSSHSKSSPSNGNCSASSSEATKSVLSTTDSFPSFTTSHPHPAPALHPIPIQQLKNSSSSSSHSKEEEEGDENKKKRKKRDQYHEEDLHLEDINCGTHPQNFTVPLGVYSSITLAVAPLLPSKRLVFLNETQSVTRGKEGSSSNLLQKAEVRQPNPFNATLLKSEEGVCTNSLSPSSSSDEFLLTKQTERGSESSSEVTRSISINTPGEAMEVDTNVGSIVSRGGERHEAGVPIKTRTYGPHNEVEVVLVSRSSRTPSPAPPVSSSLKQHHPSTSSSLGEDGGDPSVKVPKTSRVHFSPVVSEISWRESYIDQSSEFSGSQEDINRKLFEGVDESESDSLVRPLQVEMMSESGGQQRQSSTSGNSSSSGRIVEKVQLRSSFLQGGDEEEDEDDLERKLTLHLQQQDGQRGRRSKSKSPVGDEGDFLDGGEEGRKEPVLFRSGAGGVVASASSSNGNGGLDLYEDVNVSIEPGNKVHGSTTLSMVPDLLSQCENATQGRTHIDVRIEQNATTPTGGKPPLRPKPARSKSHSPVAQSKSEIPPPIQDDLLLQHHQPQQQMFPKMFAEETNGSGTFGKLSKNNSSSSSANKKKSSKGFSVGRKSRESSKERDPTGNKQDKDVTNNKERQIDNHSNSDPSKENKGKSTKPGFFERLSKIRLSGSKPKKQKVHPKSDEASVQPLKSQNAVNLNGNSSSSSKSSSKLPSQPILKKSNQPPQPPPRVSSTSSSQITTTIDYENEPEPTESHQAFENILEEIAGIRSIRMRMDKPGSEQGSPERSTSRTTSRSTPTPPSSSSQSQPNKDLRNFAKRKQFYHSNANREESTSPSPQVSPAGRSLNDLNMRLSQFKEETSNCRVVISKSHPDLELIEDMVRQQSLSPEPPKAQGPPPSQQQVQSSPDSSKSSKKSPVSEAGQKNEREWYKLLKSAAEKYYYRGSKDKGGEEKGKEIMEERRPMGIRTGIVETDLDTGTSREMLDSELDKKVPLYTISSPSEIPSSTGPISSPGTSAKARSLTNLSTRLPLSIAPSKYDDVDVTQGELTEIDERAKSYEFLLDDNQKSASVPPENQLRTETRQLSEHELRIQRSLQRLNVPDWYKKHEASSRTSTPERPSSGQEKGGTLKILSRRSEYGSAGGLAGGWPGLSTFKAPSMSSLQGSQVIGPRYSGSLHRSSNFVRGRPTTMSTSRLSRESLTGSASASHSPSAFDRSSFTYGLPFTMTRFAQSRLSSNSGTATPTSTAGSTTSTAYVKKPYLGWRSQEKLNALAAVAGDGGAPKLSVYLPPEERMAVDVLRSKVHIRPPISDRPPIPKPPTREKTTNNGTSSVQPSNNGEKPVHQSIREVTKAINQYVAKGGNKGEAPPKPEPRKKSPGRKAIWIESSFVGRKPVDK